MIAGSDTDSECGSNVPGPSTIIVHKKCNVHKMCVTMYSTQDFKPNETQSTENGSRRWVRITQIIGEN